MVTEYGGKEILEGLLNVDVAIVTVAGVELVGELVAASLRESSDAGEICFTVTVPTGGFVPAKVIVWLLTRSVLM